MKHRLIKKIAAAATLPLLVMCTSIALAGNAPNNTSPYKDRFEISIPQSLADGNDIAVELRFLSSECIEKVLAEKTESTEVTRPALKDLRTKWVALSEELADQTTEGFRVALFQQDILTYDQLVQKRFERRWHSRELRPMPRISG